MRFQGNNLYQEGNLDGDEENTRWLRNWSLVLTVLPQGWIAISTLTFGILL